jgi:aminopeptidase N
MNGIRRGIFNYDAIIGQYGVNNEGSGDMYPKGAWILHTLRHVVNDDAKWWKILLRYSEIFRHKIITTKDVDDFFSKEMGLKLTPIFDQYLRTTKIPVVAFSESNGKVSYKYEETVPGFNLPVDIEINGKTKRIWPGADAKILEGDAKLSEIKVRTDYFLVNVAGIK